MSANSGNLVPKPFVFGVRIAAMGLALVAVSFAGYETASLLGMDLSLPNSIDLGTPSVSGLLSGTAGVGWLVASRRQ